MSEPVRCPRVGKWIGGCRFVARYDKEPANTDGVAEVTGLGAEKFFETLRRITYVRDVCTTCGRTIERQETAA